MAEAYHADVADGNQWVLAVTQGERQKAIYFNNHFPKSILLHSLLSERRSPATP
ncbi:MAG: hypothetical protein O3C21_16755 [Verrucomicrobia bacterium]|nr:hypothetical protein [Verrucomicrobiota bacterium]